MKYESGELIIQGLIEIYNDWLTPLTARAARMVKRVKVHGSGLSYAVQRVHKLFLENACTDWNQVGHLAETFHPSWTVKVNFPLHWSPCAFPSEVSSEVKRMFNDTHCLWEALFPYTNQIWDKSRICKKCSQVLNKLLFAVGQRNMNIRPTFVELWMPQLDSRWRSVNNVPLKAARAVKY